MSSRPHFDSVIVRLRGRRCIVASVAPPFRTAFWQDVEAVGHELAVEGLTAAALQGQEVQEKFLSALAERLPQARVFRPTWIGFRSRPEDIRQREDHRCHRALVTFCGACSREVVLGTLELLANRLQPRGAIEVQFKEGDTVSDWTAVEERIGEALNYLVRTRQLDCQVTAFGNPRTANGVRWRFFYDRPRVRLGWLASELARCNSREDLDQYCREAPVFRIVQGLCEIGIWPRIVLPASNSNMRLLPDLVLALIEATRGGTIEVVPAALVLPETDLGPADVDELVETVLAIYRNTRIPLHLVWPLSWVKQRIDSDRSLIGSAMAAGTEVAVLPYGDLYAGECCVGMDQWRLGNVLQSHSAIAWERVDALPEAFSRSTAPARCKTCDWRYRCGGVDPAVRLAQDRHRVTSCDEWSEWCELYCAPRKALFEEMLWDSVEAAAGQNEQRPRERIELHEDGLTYQAVRIATEPQPERTSSTSTQQGGKAGIERGAPSIEEEQAFGREAVGAAPGGVTR